MVEEDIPMPKSTCVGEPTSTHTDTTPLPHRCTEVIDILPVRYRKTRGKSQYR